LKDLILHAQQNIRTGRFFMANGNVLLTAAAGEALTTPAWAALLVRVGDNILLSIFLNHIVLWEVAPQRWLQLAGRRLSDDVAYMLSHGSLGVTRIVFP